MTSGEVMAQLVEKVLFLRVGHPVTAPTPTPPRGEGLCLEGTAYPQPAKGLRPLNLIRFFNRLSHDFGGSHGFDLSKKTIPPMLSHRRFAVCLAQNR